jgi:hypothetical protein
MNEVVTVGVDVGSRRDYCALAIVHANPDAAALIGLDRARGLEIEDIPAALLLLLHDLDSQLPNGLVLALAIDATGAGQQPAEKVHRLLQPSTSPASPGFTRLIGFRGVVATGGDTERRSPIISWQHNVPRHRLAEPYVMATRTGLLDLSRLPPTQARWLAEEMRGFARTTLPSGRDRLDHPSGGHDDLLSAQQIAWWLSRAVLGQASALFNPASSEVRIDRPWSPSGAQFGPTGWNQGATALIAGHTSRVWGNNSGGLPRIERR